MEEKVDVWVVENAEGKKIVGATKAGKEYLFNSKYSDDALIEAWTHQTDISHYRTIAVVFGMGNGEYVRTLRKKNADMTILVFEPSEDIALVNKNDIGCEDLIDDPKTIIAIGEESLKGFHDTLSRLVVFEVIKYTKLFVVPNYNIIFTNSLKRFLSIFQECMSVTLSNRHSSLRFQGEMKENINNNILDLIQQYSMKDVMDNLMKVDKDGVPAIVVAAGPSLDKNIKELKRAVGKSFIIAVDTALKPLAKEGIIPDVTLSIDSHKPLSLFDNEDTKDVPIILGLTSNSKIKDVHRGIRIYEGSQESILDRFIIDFGKDNIVLATGGSVTCDAFSLAQGAGFKTIIFIGLDLAYSGNRAHSRASYGKEQVVNTDNTDYFDVESIDGGLVKTEANLELYRRWFEHAADVWTDIKLIDATEGGAKKRGMEIMTLKDAIDRECKRSCGSFRDVINSTNKFFTEDEQNYIKNELKHFDVYCNEIRSRLNKGIKAYEKLDEFNRKGKYTGKEFKATYDFITEINNWISNDRKMAYLAVYVVRENYEVKSQIFDDMDNIYDEIKLVVDSGIKLISAMLGVINEMEDYVKKLMSDTGTEK